MTSLHEYPASPFPLAKRKTSEAYPSPKPTKLAKPLPSNLAFDPFNPHPGMSKEERKMARMIRNRTAAQASRDRKKEHVAELESRVRELEEQLKLLSDSFPATAPACLRPCCQQATASAALQPSRKPSVVTRAIQTDDQIRCPPHSLSDSIDPSIIQSNPLPPQPQPLLPPTLSKPNIPGKDSLTLDPQLKNEHPIDTQQPISIQPTNATISPTQAEYLSRVRIHVLEEENIQLKNQLEYELKKSHQFKCQLLRNQLTHPSTSVPNQQQLTTDKHHTDQEGLIEMMLEDEEIEHLLLASSKNPSASPPTTKLEQDSYTHSVDLAQHSLDWDSLLLDREGSCSTVSPVAPRATSSLSSGHHNQEQDPFGTEWKISSGTQGSSDTDDWPMMMMMVDDDNGRGSSRASSSSVLGGIEPSQPETPPCDLQPQAPAADAARALPGESSSSACSSSPAITQSGVFSHPRLVAREVDHPRVSLQRNGGEKSTRRGCYMRWSAATTYGPVVSHRAAVSALCSLLIPYLASSPAIIVTIMMMIRCCPTSGAPWMPGILLAWGMMTACWWVACWVAWETRSNRSNARGLLARTSRASAPRPPRRPAVLFRTTTTTTTTTPPSSVTTAREKSGGSSGSRSSSMMRKTCLLHPSSPRRPTPPRPRTFSRTPSSSHHPPPPRILVLPHPTRWPIPIAAG